MPRLFNKKHSDKHTNERTNLLGEQKFKKYQEEVIQKFSELGRDYPSESVKKLTQRQAYYFLQHCKDNNNLPQETMLTLLEESLQKSDEELKEKHVERAMKLGGWGW